MYQPAKPKKSEKSNRGRKTKYNEKYHPLIAEALAMAGLIDEEIADKMDIAVSTFYLWAKKYPEFSEAIKAGKKGPDDQVEMALFKRAIGMQIEDTKFFQNDGKILSEEYMKNLPPDVVACIFWLKNRRPEKWRDKQEILVENLVIEKPPWLEEEQQPENES